MTTLDDLQADPNYKNPANGRALPRHAANPHTNVDLIHGGGGGGGGSSIDYTVLITAIKNSVAGIDADTNALAGILLAVDTLESIGTTGNATTSQILTAVSSILTQAQETNANTDQLETLLTSLQTTLQNESDQTQMGLVDIKEAINAIPIDVEYIPFVDYVEGGQVIGTAGVTILTLNDLVPVSISGSAPVWTLPNFGDTDASTSWKLVAPLQTVAGQNYQLQVQMNAQSTIKVLIGTEQKDLVGSFIEDFYFTGDGSIIELGILLLPNTSASNINALNVTTLASVVPETCTDFLRKIVGTSVADLKVVGGILVPHVVSGVVRTSCPIVTKNTAVFKHELVENGGLSFFEGYKSLSIRVLSGQILVSDGTNSITYPQLSDGGDILEVNYSFHQGFEIINSITVNSLSTETRYIWTGVK